MITATYESAFRVKLTVRHEKCSNAAWPPVEKPQEQEPKCDPMHEKKRQPKNNEDATSSLLEAKHFEWKSWIDNEFFDLVDLRKFKPKKNVTSRCVPTIKTDKQGNFLRADGGVGIERIPGQTEGLLAYRFSCSPHDL